MNTKGRLYKQFVRPAPVRQNVKVKWGDPELKDAKGNEIINLANLAIESQLGVCDSLATARVIFKRV